MQEKDICVIHGVGEERKKAFHRLGVFTTQDLLFFFPREYEDRSIISKIGQLNEEKTVGICATVFSAVRKTHGKSGMTLCQTTIYDDTGKLDVLWFNNPYVVNHLKVGQTYLFYGRIVYHLTGWQMQSPIYEAEGKQEQIGGIVPVYPLTVGLSQKQVSNAVREILPQDYKETLPESIRQEQKLCEINYALSQMHFPKTFADLEIARRRMVFEELFYYQMCLLHMKEESKSTKAHILADDGYFTEFCSRLPFPLTGAQKRAVLEILEDLKSGKSMNRLVQGDVGSGKTAVAAAAIYVTAKNGCQSALMAPTEILVNQHYESFCEMFQNSGIRVEKITGSMSAKTKKEIAERLIRGEIDLLIGTHAIIQKNIIFSNLAFVITDEQHRFGVAQRAALGAKGIGVHKLVMSATPIPRTLSLILCGDLDISIIDELPPGRKNVETFAVGESMRARINRFIVKNVEEGRQVYIVCPLIEESEKMDLENAKRLYETLSQTVLKNYHAALLHGAMKQKEKDEIMTDFMAGKIDVMISTTVIEVGVNVKNANLMIVENAERFGLSQLHQLRGRVGRGEFQSYCILFDELQNEQSRARLKVLCDTNDGFLISEADLKMRGSGEILGKRQSGQNEFRVADIFSDMAILKEVQGLVFKIKKGEFILSKDDEIMIQNRVEYMLSKDIAFN